MGAIKDAMAVMREVLLLTDKIDRAGKTLSEISAELRDHDRRIIRLETMVELAINVKTADGKSRGMKKITKE